MTIRVQCTGCSKGMRAPDEMAGATVNCPNCSASVSIPSVEDAKNSGAYLSSEDGTKKKKVPENKKQKTKSPTIAGDFGAVSQPDGSSVAASSTFSASSTIQADENKEDSTLAVVLIISVLITFCAVIFRPMEGGSTTPSPTVSIGTQPSPPGVSLNILANGNYKYNNADVPIGNLLSQLKQAKGNKLQIRVESGALNGSVLQAIEVAGIAGITDVEIAVE